MSKPVRAAITGAAVAAVAAGMTIAATDAQATDPISHVLLIGSAGGSYVRALNSTVTSNVTAESGVNTLQNSASSTNTAASAVVSGVATVQGISTSSKVTLVRNASNVIIGKQVRSEVKTAGVNLLNGAITIGAIDTVNVVKSTLNSAGHFVAAASANTTFVGLHAASLDIPVIVPQNFAITIPGVATVVINQSATGAVGGDGEAFGNGVAVTLLKARGSTPAGATVVVASTFGLTSNFTAPNTGHAIGGTAYGTKAHAAVGSTVDLRSDPTAPVYVPTSGTPSGSPKVVNIAGVNLAPGLTVGAVQDTADGINTTAQGFAHTSSKIANINLLNGLIKAGAITADAHASAPTGHARTIGGSSQIANLIINGTPITITGQPNQVITIAGLVTVTINQQSPTAINTTVVALHITLLSPLSNLPAGSDIQVAVASAGAI